MLKFNENAAEQAIKDKRIRKGLHAIVCTDIAKYVSDKDKTLGNMALKVSYRILKDPEDSASITGPIISEFIPLPFANPDFEGHTPPDWSYRSCAFGMHNFFPEDCPLPPLYDKEAGVTLYKDEPIGADEKEACRLEAVRLAAQKIASLWDSDDFSDMRSELFFAQIEYPEGSDFPNIKERYSEAPEGWEPGEVMEVVQGGNPVKEEKPAPKKSSRRRKKA